ncbi:MAG: hypothetical protein CL678_17770 [Bdellovibrionaceae bacterium]|nr:hypothetical protein [Pseudobdellovibrionaceae bacterium]
MSFEFLLDVRNYGESGVALNDALQAVDAMECGISKDQNGNEGVFCGSDGSFWADHSTLKTLFSKLNHLEDAAYRFLSENGDKLNSDQKKQIEENFVHYQHMQSLVKSRLRL